MFLNEWPCDRAATLRVPSGLSSLLVALGVLLAAALAGCSSMPSLPERAASTAVTDTTGTALGQLAAASLEQAGPGESGFRLLPTGAFAFDARLALARRAERSLDVQYYHLANDSVGLQFLRELRDAAARGVRIRLLVDDLYTGGEDELFCSFAAVPNVEVRLFNPLPSRGGSVLGRVVSSAHEFGRINLRMHNKLFVADNRFSVSGGRNMADEYFMRGNEANFIDMDVIVGRAGRARAVAGVRSLLEQRARLPDRAGHPRSRPERRRRRERAPLRRARARRVGRIPARSHRSARPGRGRRRVLRRPHRHGARGGSRPRRHAEQGCAAQPRRTLSTVNRSVLEELAAAHSDLLIASPYFIPGKVGMHASAR